MSHRDLLLLPQNALVRTNDVDHADWNYRWLIGSIQRQRFKLITRLLDGLNCHSILEIGYGSGVFMPELARRSNSVSGVDPHGYHREVTAALAAHGVTADLRSSSAERLPFADQSFDCIVSVSALEYIPDIDLACQEMCRVLQPGGRVIAVTPGFSPLMDFGLRVMTGEKASQYGDRRQRLLPSLQRHFRLERSHSIPALGGRWLRLYTSVRLQRP